MTPTPGESRLPFWLTPPAVVAFVLLTLAARFYVSAVTGLVRDEGYYTLWSFHPALGYLDHPPMIAWLIGLGRLLLGDGEAGIRLFPALSTAVLALAVYRIGLLLLDARSAAIAAYWFTLSVAGGLLFIAAPDAPVVTFWTLAVWAVAEYVRRRQANWWLPVGLFAGLALLSKYTAAFLGLGLLLFIVTSAERRQWLRLWQLWAGGLLALLVVSPNLLWNIQHDWASIRFQAGRLGDYGLSFGSMPDNLLDLIAGQALAGGIFVMVFVLIGLVMFLARVERPAREGLALPIFVSLPIVLYFILYTARFRVEANWPVPAWPMLTLVAAWAAVNLRPRRWFADLPLMLMRRAQAPLGLAALALIYSQAVWQPFELRQAIDRTRDMRGWRSMELEVATFAAAEGAKWVAVANDYGLAGELAAYDRFSGTRLPVVPVGDAARWRFLPPADRALLEQPALFIESANGPGDAALRYFDTAVLVGEARRVQGMAEDEEELERFEVYLVTGPKPEARASLLRQ